MLHNGIPVDIHRIGRNAVTVIRHSLVDLTDQFTLVIANLHIKPP